MPKNVQNMDTDIGHVEEPVVQTGSLHELNARTLAETHGVEFISLNDIELSPNVVGLLPQWLVHEHAVIPVRFEEGILHVAVENPIDLPVLDQINLVTGFPVKPIVATPRDIQQTISRHYGAEQLTRQDRVDAWFDKNEGQGEAERVETLVVSEDDSQIIRLVNSIIKDAIEAEASDIHFEPAGNEMIIRSRRDGILQDCLTVPSAMRLEVTTRIKVLAKMDITEKRKPQDGHIALNYRENQYDLRVSVLPTIDGEKTVVRILDKSRLATDLPSLGMDTRELDLVKNMVGRPHGMILVTGPTGSGKTTTLYAMLRSIDSVIKNVITVENPVEYRLERINQIQVDPDAGQSFAAVLRAILRQDPDVIMVGEIRDLETAEIAVQAALTGHLVLSTLHTNDAASAITRLRELGIPAYLLSSCIALSVAQRLVRKVCPDCGQSEVPDKKLLKELGVTALPSHDYRRGVGCPFCQDSGYRGRQVVFEILPVSNEIQQAVLNDASAQDMKEIAMRAGMNTLLDAAILKMTQGLTTPEEVKRVIAAEGH